jgi:serine protease Do
MYNDNENNMSENMNEYYHGENDQPIGDHSDFASDAFSAEGATPQQNSGSIWDTPAAEVPNPQPVSAEGANTTYGDEAYTQQPEDSSRAYSPNYYKPGYNPNNSGNIPPEKHNRHGGGKKIGMRVAAFIVAVALCAGASAGAATWATSARINKAIKNNELTTTTQVVLGNQSSSTDADTIKNNTASSASSGSVTAEDIYNMGCQQVVGISITGTTTSTNIFGVTSEFAVSGSGFVVSSDGYIVTNYHVVEYGVQGYDIDVMFQDGTTYKADIVGYEEENDVAVLKIDATGLDAVSIGSSDELHVGETIYCIGNPLGELAYSMSSGIVSATDRVISTDETTDINMFQIDAAVNHGNSGGPVYNSDGEVVGIVTAKYTDSDAEGLGFAIPIDDVMKIVTDLIENGHVTGKAYMGVVVTTVEQSAIEYYNLVAGACVTSVAEGSAAENASIKVGDIITALGDKTITSSTELRTARRAYRAGDTTDVTIYRGGETMTLSITFDEETEDTTTDTTTNTDTDSQQQQQQQLPNSGSNGGSDMPDFFQQTPGYDR